MTTDDSKPLAEQGPQQSTLSGGALDDEAHPERSPQDVGELGSKMSAEASEGGGPLDKLKKVAEEFDRDVSGEYERRSDGSAP